jgi:DNA-binding CsgD family transcriptional regulator
MGLLTAFERQVLRLKLQGLSAYAIAREFGKEPRTAYRSIDNACKKLEEAKKTLEWAQQLGYPEKLESKPKNEPATLRQAF